ncbi:MAG: hypothetical protein RI933_275 [Actinomycetota bacterium]|jgi:glutaredoxin|uniref:Glutaredoxin domain-containing protein n=1 Tax=Candidatus Rhodoluna planktonica TaxID=535712 RepID=A0A1D9DXT2_9MICO|nr:glutaredoxin domain-containing protein [Candidatus Rhodoluna planktonica]AOY55617.1 hypothetical protein A4Z71_00990 [Candidatus Rhodoluna planktonica]
MSEVIFYGADWCSDCRRSKAQLNELGVKYELRDVEKEPEFAIQSELVAGRKNIPVILFEDGKFLVEPSNIQLADALRERGLIA